MNRKLEDPVLPSATADYLQSQVPVTPFMTQASPEALRGEGINTVTSDKAGAIKSYVAVNPFKAALIAAVGGAVVMVIAKSVVKRQGSKLASLPGYARGKLGSIGRLGRFRSGIAADEKLARPGAKVRPR